MCVCVVRVRVCVCASVAQRDVSRRETGAGVCSGRQLCNFNCEVKDNTVIFFLSSSSQQRRALTSEPSERPTSRPRNSLEPPEKIMFGFAKVSGCRANLPPGVSGLWGGGFSLMGGTSCPPAPDLINVTRHNSLFQRSTEFISHVRLVKAPQKTPAKEINLLHYQGWGCTDTTYLHCV